MKIYSTVKEVMNELEIQHSKGLSIGFVPTMGALHQGHISLIEQAGRENDLVVMSIFVNPTQFNNAEDLKKYPRDIEKDIQLIKETKCSIIFAPNEIDIYPDENSKKSNFEFGSLANMMEGKFRPSHFDGVGMVVKRLFEIIKPTKAYFGQKDIQQFLIIDYLNRHYFKHLKIELVKCPIIRELDGLAMSSRNLLLDSECRKSAALISKMLTEAKRIYKDFSVNELKKYVIDNINKDPNLKIEYFEIVTDPDLEEIEIWNENLKMIACIAVFAGNVRLIDNIYFN